MNSPHSNDGIKLDEHNDAETIKSSPKTDVQSLDEEKCDEKSDNFSRIRLNEQQLSSITLNELISLWKKQDFYINHIEHELCDLNKERDAIHSLRESEDKMRHQLLELKQRENILVMRLTTKEQEMQEMMSQIQELKHSQMPQNGQLQNTLLDRAVNVLFEKMKKEVDDARAKVEEMQNELSAWKFTPDSNTGKRLMAKCRLLYQENEELGKMISSGRVAKLEGELGLQKNFSEEMKKSQSELDDFLLELDEDVEGMQNTIYYLQQSLKEAKEQLLVYERDNTIAKRVNHEIDCDASNDEKRICISNNDTDTIDAHSLSPIKSSESSHNIQSDEIFNDESL